MEQYDFNPDSRDEAPVQARGYQDSLEIPSSIREMPNIIQSLSSYDKDGKQKFYNVHEEGPTTRTRSKNGPSHVDDIPQQFLVQTPHCTFKPEKNKKCQVCGKHARTPSDLLRHMRVHTGERPFPCVACNKTFKCKRSQLTHQYLSHGIRDGLSEHRLDVLDHRKVKRNTNKLKSNFCNQVPTIIDKIMHNSYMKQKMEQQPVVVDQDEDTEIMAGEEISSMSDGPVSFVGLFNSQKENGIPMKEDINHLENETKEQEPPVIKEEHCSFLEKQNNDDEDKINNCVSLYKPKKRKKDHSRKVPILRIKTHKCTHCKRQFRSIYTLRYHLRSMHDEKVYLSPALESRLKKRRWIPPHVRLQKSKIGSNSSLSHKQKSSSQKEKTYSFLPTYPNEKIEQKFFSQISQNFSESLSQPQSKNDDAIDLHVNTDFSLEIKKEKVDSYEDDINNNVSGTVNEKADRSLRDIMNLNENEAKQMSYFANSLPNTSANATGTAFTFNSTTNTSASNPFVLPPHIFFPSTPATDEGLMNEKPISWESLQVTSESVLISKLEAVHPGTQQKYVLYKCGLCGKAFASLRVICGHLALHNDTSKEKDCEKCGASFKWKTELDSHLECHQASDRKFMPTSPFLPSYYVNPFPIPVVTPSEQNVMSTTRLLPYPFFPMPQQIPQLMQPGFFPFFAAAALQPQMQSTTNNHEETIRNSSHSPPQNSPTAENFEDKNLVQGCNFQCKLCPKTFDRIFSLQRHERIHSGVKACFCKICGRGFSELRNLRHHIIRFHAESAQKEPLPYRRRPNRMRNVSSSQKLVSFLKKTAVRILNSMGQSKSETSNIPEENNNGSGKLQASEASGQQELERNEVQNLSTSITINTVENLQEQNTLNTMPTLFDATSQVTRLSPSQDLNEVPPPKLSPGLSEETKEIGTVDKIETGNNGAVEVLQDPKRSLLGNRRKGRPFKLSTMSSQALNLGGDDILFPLTESSFLEKHVDPISESSLLQATEILNGCLKPEVAFPQLNYYNMEQSPNEPIDMRNPTAKEKSEVNMKKEVENNEIQDRNPVFPTDANLGMNMYNDTTQNSTGLKIPESFESRCLFPCSYCHKSFNSITDINRHMSFHADIRPFKCPYCSYCSRTNSQLKVHMMRHEGIKHYMCQICNYNGVTQSDLNRHLKTRTHLLRSRNVCACCGTGFHTRSLSDEHYKSCHLSANSGNNQDQNSKNQPELATKTTTSSNNRNRVTRLKQFRTPEEKIKSEFYQKLCDLSNMGLTIGDFLQQSSAAAVNLEK